VNDIIDEAKTFLNDSYDFVRGPETRRLVKHLMELLKEYRENHELRKKVDVIPVPMRLKCEVCGELHIDEGEHATKPHHTHSCQYCGCTWRPAIVHTVGVRFLPGFKNSKGPSEMAIDTIAYIRKMDEEGIPSLNLSMERLVSLVEVVEEKNK
jgi:hypothetical protein